MNKLIMNAITVCAAIGVAATPAIAGDNYSREVSKAKENVEVADLDLTSVEGRETLEKRIAKAVKRECRYDVRGQIRKMKDERACRAAANKKLAVEFNLASGDQALGG